jgi:hypothetical protein
MVSITSECAGIFEIGTSKVVWREIEHIKPYLRPMSSMTEEEFKEYHSMLIDIDNFGLMNQRLITKIVD